MTLVIAPHTHAGIERAGLKWPFARSKRSAARARWVQDTLTGGRVAALSGRLRIALLHGGLGWKDLLVERHIYSDGGERWDWVGGCDGSRRVCGLWHGRGRQYGFRDGRLRNRRLDCSNDIRGRYGWHRRADCGSS